MADHHNDREVRLDYAFDRLLTAKLQQAYEILVPDQVRFVRNSLLNGDGHEECGDLRKSVLGQAERREHYCEPNGGIGGVRPQAGLRRSG
jgi:hypothetical protein